MNKPTCGSCERREATLRAVLDLLVYRDEGMDDWLHRVDRAISIITRELEETKPMELEP